MTRLRAQLRTRRLICIVAAVIAAAFVAAAVAGAATTGSCGRYAATPKEDMHE